MKEYGSNVQKLADHIATMEDPAKRTLYAHILVELMRQIHPNMRDNQDYYNKLWDDLYIMSDFEMDVESPYPPPSKELLGKKPLKVGYNQHKLNYHHYGRNIELLVEKAIETEDPDDRLAFVSYLYRLMRSFYNAWNRDNPEDVLLLEHLEELSEGQLKAEIDYIRKNGAVESSPKDRNSNVDRSRGNTSGGYKAQTNFNNERAKNVSNSGGSNRPRHSNKYANRNSGSSNTNNPNNRNRRK
ncbi:DUF4290 domain-containing protein [Arundinibacter roseus]|uniref:DUF4290 domain-containing protein n=1 Tax=Arundinibacter roseus TaxID=2070510 RepID=A0A4R4KDG4_9BACT|nr:DUF4290 domain-containing protein [Arundinibacter roseus]TDB65878.1 DUF4290 domain-containing protein [Arundinibacter roseus]